MLWLVVPNDCICTFENSNIQTTTPQNPIQLTIHNIEMNNSTRIKTKTTIHNPFPTKSKLQSTTPHAYSTTIHNIETNKSTQNKKTQTHWIINIHSTILAIYKLLRKPKAFRRSWKIKITKYNFPRLLYNNSLHKNKKSTRTTKKIKKKNIISTWK